MEARTSKDARASSFSLRSNPKRRPCRSLTPSASRCPRGGYWGSSPSSHPVLSRPVPLRWFLPVPVRVHSLDPCQRFRPLLLVQVHQLDLCGHFNITSAPEWSFPMCWTDGGCRGDGGVTAEFGFQRARAGGNGRARRDDGVCLRRLRDRYGPVKRRVLRQDRFRLRRAAESRTEPAHHCPL